MQKLVSRLVLSMFAVPLLHAQDDLKVPSASIPKLRATAHTAAEFAPQGWKVEAEKSGDLNADGRPDLVFVLHEDSRRLELKVHAPAIPYHVDDIDTNPRILGIAFANSDDNYTLAAQNSTLIPRWTDPTRDDAFDRLTVQRGAFSLELSDISACECQLSDNPTFTFRYQHGRIELIGFKNTETNRGAGTDTDIEANFSIGVETASASDVAANSPVRERRKRLKRKPLLSLDQVGSGINFFGKAQDLWLSADR